MKTPTPGPLWSPTRRVIDGHWTAGQHGVGTWHGAGPVMAQKIMLQRAVDFEHEKNLVKETLKLKQR